MRRHLTTLAVAVAALTAPASAHAAIPVPSPAIPQTAPYMNVGQPGTAIPSKSGFRSIYFLGDSLTAGIFRVAPAYFPGWKVGINGVGGRPLNDGMGILAATALPERTILAMGLFTNDLPTRTWALKQAVRESLRRVGPSGCVIWATIHRPAVGGPSWQGALPGDVAARKPYPASAAGIGYAKANAALRALAAQNPNMRLVDWAKSLHTSPMAMEDNDVHPASLSGWQRRAQMYATAARSC
jgi:hypothetical protein